VATEDDTTSVLLTVLTELALSVGSGEYTALLLEADAEVGATEDDSTNVLLMVLTELEVGRGT
jgi:hypothetical protein